MGVPGFYSWLSKRYPMIKHMVSKQSLPQVDYLYLDMNGIIYKCVRDDSIIFKAQLMPKELEEIWIEVFNYINELVNLIKPTKMILMALDGVAPRCKMNNQRSRRFKSAKQYKQFINRFYGYTGEIDSQENFKNNSISPGTRFMEQLNQMLHFFIQKKIQEDDYWKRLSVIFTGSDTPGQGEHKIMEFVRANHEQFEPEDTHCFYGADADLIMLGLTLPIKNACIIRQQYIHGSDKVRIIESRKEKQINFELIYLSILRECLDLQYKQLAQRMKIPYDVEKVTQDFVLLFFFIGNDFLPRIYAYNIREKTIEKLIEGFKNYLVATESYISGETLNLNALLILFVEVGKFQAEFYSEKKLYFDKLLQREEKNFDDELQKIFLAKMRHEEETLLGLKQMYTNLDGSGRNQYYNSYFSIDPMNQSVQLSYVLAYYVYGLKFVYQYYFKRLASWSWYYPYYFAPLLCDLQYYLASIIQNNVSLTEFQVGEPFQPFKQLLCILPKESAELLPQNFREYLVSKDSTLRNPMDYYPDEVESVTYGSTRDHQSIALIPFLDHNVITQVYEQQISKTSEVDLKRNVKIPSRLYKYNHNAKAHEVISPFSLIESFTSQINITNVVLYERFQWSNKTNMPHAPVNQGQEHLLKLPTLYMRPFQLRSYQYSGQTFFNIKVKIDAEEKITYKLGQTIFYGYPLEHSGRIQAILTRKTFTTSSEMFNLDCYDSLQRDIKQSDVRDIKLKPAALFQYLIKELPKSRFIKDKFFKYIDVENTETFYFLVNTRSFIRNAQGQFCREFINRYLRSYSIVPGLIISKQKFYQNTRNNIRFKNITQQFQKGEEVLLTHPNADLCGAKGKVIGYDHSKAKEAVIIEILQKPKYTKEKLKDFIKIISTKADIFFTLRFASEIIGTKFDHLLTILSNINVITPSNSKLPPSIDIGLNFIERSTEKVVPNLVRINFYYDKEKKIQKPFHYLEISFRALQIILEYKEKFPQIFAYMEERHYQLIDTAKMNNEKIRWDTPILSSEIYPEDGAKSLMKVYKWLVQKQETHMPISSIFSKQVQKKRIQQLQKEFIQLTRKKEENKKQKFKREDRKNRTIAVDPNFLFSQRLSKLGSIYLKDKPKNHQIGDLVICITPQFFGHYGVIIGIDNNKYEVLFDEHSFGKSDLGGLCDNLWGFRFEFRQILNIDTWPQNFSERFNPKEKEQKRGLGWIDQTDQFYPLYQYKPFQDFEDIKAFIQKEQNRKFFTPEFLDYLQKVRTNLKQVDVDSEYNVVDNKKADHRYKYNKKIVYIEKGHIEDSANMAKFIDGNNTHLAEFMSDDEDQKENKKNEGNLLLKEVVSQTQQIIENKIVENESGDIGDEEDAADILG